MATQTTSDGNIAGTSVFDAAARLLSANVMVDMLQILNVSEPVTVGFEVSRVTVPVGQPVPGLVQTVTLENAVESRTSTAYSIKVPLRTELRAGQAVKVLYCRAEPDLAGKVIFVDKVSQNGMAMLRKATGTDFAHVNQEGKGAL